jgi:transcriptional regulator with XRE-family HTH domain
MIEEASLKTTSQEEDRMSEYLSINPLREDFINNDEDYRYAYAEDFLNTYIATQIKVLRDERGLTQSALAKATGTQQPGIARLENVNYSKWKTETLKKIARALGVRLKITFETFGTLLEEDASFSRQSLQRPKFDKDPAFKETPAPDATGRVIDATHLFTGTPANSTAAQMNYLPFAYPVEVTKTGEVGIQAKFAPSSPTTITRTIATEKTTTLKVAGGQL